MLPKIDFQVMYDGFNAPIVELDCGTKCAPYNPNGIPFCCDICEAVPAVYTQEWAYLQPKTDLWQRWRGDECANKPEHPENLLEQTPKSMLLLACLGPKKCQRQYRALSCRQFPFFPYLTEDYRFLGLVYEWAFEGTCWVISNLESVSQIYRGEFIQTFDELFNQWPHEMEGYANRSEHMRTHFLEEKRPIPILHRNGGYYLLSPRSERLQKIAPDRLPKFSVYK
jgi:hypothetical protein